MIAVNLLMSFVVLPRLDTAFLAEPRWGATSLSAVGGVWSVATALAAAIVTLLLTTGRRLPVMRASVDAGANAAVLPAFSVASLVGFGAVVAALPAFALVRDWVLGLGGGPLVSLAVATNVLSALTGSASGGLTIALDALGPTYMQLAAQHGIDPALLHRVAVIGAGTLDSLPHNGAVVTLLAVCGSSHAKSYFDIVMVGIVGALLALVAVIVLGACSDRSLNQGAHLDPASPRSEGVTQARFVRRHARAVAPPECQIRLLNRWPPGHAVPPSKSAQALAEAVQTRSLGLLRWRQLRRSTDSAGPHVAWAHAELAPKRAAETRPVGEAEHLGNLADRNVVRGIAQQRKALREPPAQDVTRHATLAFEQSVQLRTRRGCFPAELLRVERWRAQVSRDRASHSLHQRQIDDAAGFRHTVGGRHDAGTHHRLDRPGKLRPVAVRQMRYIPLQQDHIIRQQVAFGRVECRSPRTIEQWRNRLEVVARQVKLDAFPRSPHVRFLSQRVDERYSGGSLVYVLPNLERGRTRLAKADAPMVHRVVANQGLGPGQSKSVA